MTGASKDVKLPWIDLDLSQDQDLVNEDMDAWVRDRLTRFTPAGSRIGLDDAAFWQASWFSDVVTSQTHVFEFIEADPAQALSNIEKARIAYAGSSARWLRGELEDAEGELAREG